MPDDSITISPGPQFMSAMLLAIAADALQIFVFPAFVAGALSPPTTCSTWASPSRWFACSDGTGNFCHHFSPS